MSEISVKNYKQFFFPAVLKVKSKFYETNHSLPSKLRYKIYTLGEKITISQEKNSSLTHFKDCFAYQNMSSNIN